MNKPRILSVGQCSFDHGLLSRHLRTNYGAELAAATSIGNALVTLRAGQFDLVLVNRVFDSDGSSGFDLIKAIKADPELAGTPVMLVSNYEDAQIQAQALGAVHGFGKTEVLHEHVPALEAVFARMV